ncbi:hypothetical protein F8154_13965 [Alkaliphilus pronyensis]|uniref:PQQ-binding-like beta-propeller repeat protein n=1 Tax=Alkaliphilus pronyensis TaxID=1482732 RepID=A0A6I0FBY0_9FIRM|nr:DUF5711 family protein [Alkaliphilus pronyensis]KAB3530294.1 hypothetical protein F8154_13965 [Alkaliphilus pronyensis]
MGKGRKKLWLVIMALGILSILIPITKGAFQNKGLYTNKEAITTKEIQLPHSSEISYHKFNDGLLQYWDGTLFYHNSNTKLNWSLHIGALRPLIKTSKDSIFLYDNSKNQLIKINSLGEIDYRKILDKTINLIEVCHQNYVLAIHDKLEKSPLKHVTILNQEGSITGEITLNSGDILKGALSGKVSRVALHTIDWSSGELSKNLLIYDLEGDLIKLNKVNDIVLDICYKNDKMIGSLSNSVFALTKDGQARWSNEVKQIQRVVLTSEDFFVVHAGSNEESGLLQGRNRIGIKIYDYKGTLLGEKALKDTIKGLDYSKENILYYTERTIYVLSKSGDLLVEYDYNGDIQEAFIFEDNYLSVVTKEKLAFIRILE